LEGDLERPVSEVHLVPNLSDRLNKESWERLLESVPESLRWEIQFSEALGRHGGCWTCTPSNHEEVVPLTIGGKPVVIPVASHYPLTAATSPPPDPHPQFISPVERLQDEVIEEIFDTYKDAEGFYLLINGLLQIMVPDEFDHEYAISHLPNEFGGLKVSYIPQALLSTTDQSSRPPPAATQVDVQGGTSTKQRTRPVSMVGQSTAVGSLSLSIGSTVRASLNNAKVKGRFEAKLGVRTQHTKSKATYVTIPTHLITDALAASKTTSIPENWAQDVKILVGSKDNEVTHHIHPYVRPKECFSNIRIS
jgi:hypothetical protein